MGAGQSLPKKYAEEYLDPDYHQTPEEMEQARRDHVQERFKRTRYILNEGYHFYSPEPKPYILFPEQRNSDLVDSEDFARCISYAHGCKFHIEDELQRARYRELWYADPSFPMTAWANNQTFIARIKGKQTWFHCGKCPGGVNVYDDDDFTCVHAAKENINQVIDATGDHALAVCLQERIRFNFELVGNKKKLQLIFFVPQYDYNNYCFV